ncbi:unnamed protein product, partial [marine sediment metagenome]
VIDGNLFEENDSLDAGLYDGMHITDTIGTVISRNICLDNDRWGIRIDGMGQDGVKVSLNYTDGNTAGDIIIFNNNCRNTQVEWNTVEGGTISDGGTNTRSYGNYDPSANAFVGNVGVAPF